MLETVPLHGHDLKVHLAPSAVHTSPLIVYATGDTGWRDTDKALFHTLATWGYPVAGVSAPEYVDHLGDEENMPGPEDVATDFAEIVTTAETALGLASSTPVVLVGISRGAGLAVAVGSASLLGGRLLGIVAIALTREEENVSVQSAETTLEAELAPLETYGILPSLGETRVAVIQSTNDEYVPAAEARALFGPDTTSRRLRAIDSENHSFDGARVALDKEMKKSFEWIVQR